MSEQCNYEIQTTFHNSVHAHCPLLDHQATTTMSAALKIWGRTNSNNVKKVLWVAAELGLKYERLDAGMQYGVVNTPEYRALNPNGQVPTIQDGDTVIWESNAITRYLAAKHAANTPLYPASLEQRALADQWMDWSSTTFFPLFRLVFWGILRTPADQQDWNKIKEDMKGSEKLLEIPEATLAKQPYLSGQEFGIGDIPLGVFIYTYFELDTERTTRLPNLRAWYERLKQRPAYQKAVMIPLS